jgi:uncharacterized protein (DUF58 family)
MDTAELLKKVHRIEIKTRGISNQIFSGEYHSAFKGRGMAFSEVREYVPGDEVRTIDWNVTARLGHPFVKVFEEERELTVILLVDVSGSESFGTNEQLKNQQITEICAVLAFSAIQNNDKIGVIFFSDKVEKFIPPKKGKSHILHIIRELIEFKPDHNKTNIGEALRYLINVVKKRSIGVLISDFMDEGYERALKIANRKHDLVALRIYDPREQELPSMGLVPFRDAETDELRWVNTSSHTVRRNYKARALEQQAYMKDLFRRSGVDHASIATTESYIKPLMNLFKRRG